MSEWTLGEADHQELMRLVGALYRNALVSSRRGTHTERLVAWAAALHLRPLALRIGVDVGSIDNSFEKSNGR